jgi:hypothetical protein
MKIMIKIILNAVDLVFLEHNGNDNGSCPIRGAKSGLKFMTSHFKIV